jgi:glycosyltransferase involved in cell wall biosynthesis
VPRQKQVRIAIFHNLPHGGAKRYLYEISQRLSKKYHIDEYKLSTSSSYLDLRKVVGKTGTYYYHDGKSLLSICKSMVQLPRIHKQIAKDINKNGYDLVITNHDYFTKSPYLHKFLTIPSLYICHEPQREFYERASIHAPRMRERIINILRLPIKYVDRLNARASNVMIANSKYSKKYLGQVYGVSPILIYPGVDTKKFIFSTKKKNFLLAIGSLMPIKGHSFVIRSLGKIKKKDRPPLVIVGSAKRYYKDKLIKLAKKEDVECRILDHVSDLKMKKLLSSALAYVSGAHREPFGLSIIEAMASGTPVVVVSGGGAGEQIVNGINGFVTKRNETEFAEKLSQVINSTKGFRVKSRNKFNKKWGWDKTVSELDQIIKDMLRK